MPRLFARWFGASTLGRDHFEALHRANPDPWNFETSAYERDKRQATLEALPRATYQSAFEIGCSIGVLTALLAPRCRQLLAVDVAEAALTTARARCRDLPHVRFARMRVPDEFPDQRFDLIVLSEVGYFWSRRELAQARRRLVRHLDPGGHLLVVHWTGPIPESPATVSGDAVHQAFVAAHELQHRYALREPAYRLDLFERRERRLADQVVRPAQRFIRRRHQRLVVCADLPADGRLVSSSADGHAIIVRGWAGAPEGVATVDVAIDGQRAGVAAYGLPRPDVAALFPVFGANTGFSFALPVARSSQRQHVLQVTARSSTGRTAIARHTVDLCFRAPAFEFTPRAIPDVDQLTRFLASDERLSFVAPGRPCVSVVLVLHNRAELTLACLRSLLAAGAPSPEIVVVDNASTDATPALLDRVDGATILRNASDLHYVAAANMGARLAAGEYLLLLNNDTEVAPDALASAVARLDGDTSIGVVGGRLVLYDGRLQEAGGVVWRDGRCFGYGRGDAPAAPPYMFVRDVDYCAGAFLLTRRDLFQSLGGLDERYAPAYYEDADYCLRVWERGRRVVFDPRVMVWHVEHATYTPRDVSSQIARNHPRFYERHRARLAGHPANTLQDSGASRSRRLARRILVVGDEIPLRESSAQNGRVRERIQGLVDAGFAVTFYPLASARVEWREIYRSNPETVEFLNGYGDEFLGALLVDRAGEYEAVVPTSARAAAALEAAASSVYAGWLRRYDYLTAAERDEIAHALQHWHRRPRIGIVLLAHHAPIPLLRAAIASLQQQVYPDWELQIAAAMPDEAAAALDALSRADARIRPGAAPLGGADYVAFLEPDAELHPRALLHVALAVRDTQAALVYTDEDRLIDAGSGGARRADPYFKSDWNPDLLLAQDYIGGLAALRVDCVRTRGGLPPALDRCGVRRLILRLADDIRPADVVHIPRVLYHRRAGALDGASDAALVREALRRRGIGADVDAATSRGAHRLRYRSARPTVTVLVPTRDRVDLLRRCLDSVLERTRYERFDICIIENDTTDPDTLAYLETATADARVRVISSPGEFNYSAMHNRAMEGTHAEIIVFLNNDTEVVSDDWLDELVAHATRPDVGAVGARLLFPDGTLQHAGVILGAEGIASHAFLGLPAGTRASRDRAHALQEYSAVTSACMAMRRAVFLAVGGFDAQHLPVRFNDVDLCLRLREAGYRILWTPHAVLRHDGSASVGKGQDTPETSSRFAREVAYMLTRWGPALRRDPFYNPNLDTTRLDFSLAFPPAIGAETMAGAGIRNQGSGIRDQGSGIRDQGSGGIREQVSGGDRLQEVTGYRR